MLNRIKSFLRLNLSAMFSNRMWITSLLLFFNNSPQISGLSLTAYYSLTGCARVTCEVSRPEDCELYA